MRRRHSGSLERTVVRTFGRGSLLGFLSLPFAFVMARLGMRGWQLSAIRAMEDDAVAMARKGYRVASSEEIGWPQFGIVTYRVVYELADQPAEPPGA